MNIRIQLFITHWENMSFQQHLWHAFTSELAQGDWQVIVISLKPSPLWIAVPPWRGPCWAGAIFTVSLGFCWPVAAGEGNQEQGREGGSTWAAAPAALAQGHRFQRWWRRCWPLTTPKPREVVQCKVLPKARVWLPGVAVLTCRVPNNSKEQLGLSLRRAVLFLVAY